MIDILIARICCRYLHMNMPVGGNFDAAYDALFRLGIGLNLLLLLLHLLLAASSASQISMGGFLTRGIKGKSASHWPTWTSSDFRPAAPSHCTAAHFKFGQNSNLYFEREKIKSGFQTNSNLDFEKSNLDFILENCHCTAALFRSSFDRKINLDFAHFNSGFQQNIHLDFLGVFGTLRLHISYYDFHKICPF